MASTGPVSERRPGPSLAADVNLGPAVSAGTGPALGSPLCHRPAPNSECSTPNRTGVDECEALSTQATYRRIVREALAPPSSSTGWGSGA